MAITKLIVELLTESYLCILTVAYQYVQGVPFKVIQAIIIYDYSS